VKDWGDGPVDEDGQVGPGDPLVLQGVLHQTLKQGQDTLKKYFCDNAFVSLQIAQTMLILKVSVHKTALLCT
jgi:hypothetical protein